MSGTPTEAEIQTQWRNSVDILEKTRVHADGLAAAAGELDVLEQSLEGEYLPAGLANFAARYRAGMSDLVEPGRVLEVMNPVLSEYGLFLSADGSYGGNYTDSAALMRALYEHFVDNSLTVESRAITYDTSATLGASNVGDGSISRLTEDENGHDIENCQVETKRFRCRADQNSGPNEFAEVFEYAGDAASQDSLLRSTLGSGGGGTLQSLHAGSGTGGSLLRNSSFTTFDDTATAKFVGWDQTGTATLFTQDTDTTFRGSPGTTTDASLKLTGDGTTVTVKQTLANMRVSSLDPEQPYFLRVMVNKTAGTALGGSVTIRLGSQTATSTITALGTNWQEITIALDSSSWFRNFNEDAFDIEIEWSSSTSGYLLVDDVIFSPFTQLDGTWWALRGGATSWLVDDTLAFTDTGGAPATAKIQWWLFIAGLGYLPHTTGTPTFTEP